MTNGSCETSVTVCEVQYKYDVGQKIRTRMTFIDQQTQLPTDPDTVHITITSPDKTAETFNYGDPDGRISRESAGVFNFEQLFTQSGDYHYRWYSTGHGAGSFQNAWGVRETGPIECPSATDKLTAAVTEQAVGPKRSRGDQGEIEERSADDIQKLINLDRNLKQSPQAIFQRSVSKLAKYPDCP